VEKDVIDIAVKVNQKHSGNHREPRVEVCSIQKSPSMFLYHGDPVTQPGTCQTVCEKAEEDKEQITECVLPPISIRGQMWEERLQCEEERHQEEDNCGLNVV
jgi:hypothetical protein